MNLTLAGFFLFPKLTMKLKDQRFDHHQYSEKHDGRIESPLKIKLPSVSTAYMNAVISVLGPSGTILRGTTNEHIALRIVVFIIFQSHYSLTALCRYEDITDP